jgi:hypothetical protein
MAELVVACFPSCLPRRCQVEVAVLRVRKLQVQPQRTLKLL